MVGEIRFKSISLKRIFVFWIAVFFCASASAINSTGVSEVENTPLNLDTVLSCGEWKEGDAFGYYRLLVVAVNQGAGDEVYLQKVRSSIENTQAGIVWTQAIVELNNEHDQYQLDHASCEALSRNSTFVLSMTHEDSPVGKFERFLIIPDQRKRYILRKKMGSR
ncbi:hypothetical protein [Limnobacter litoralis]|uniref:Uncharacterized protein n=1 Tax=Limnobacter litoralis TaxID=481366 RepID=A0ABQ5YL49_9BURK|nr:hypothetical protein [Limnobacter litoralis]GLR25284.1 hypothetical protein GCM10007875_03720 [Limnobacter litoralis]